MKPARSFNLNRLYHQFLKPKGIPADKLPFLIAKLYEAGFIDLFRIDSGDERYIETEKLTNRANRDELFKLIGGLK